MRMRVRIEFVGLILFGIVLQSAESWNNENSKDDRNGIHDSGIGSCVISSLSWEWAPASHQSSRRRGMMYDVVV